MQPPGGKRKYEAIVTDILAGLQAGGQLTDVNPGSVVRTLAEAFAREMAEAHERLSLMYDMGFIDTATGESLNHLVALLGQERIQGTQVVGEAVFDRDPRVVGRAVVPTGTVMTIGSKIYVTTRAAELKPGQASVTVPIRAEVPAGKKPEDYVLQAHEVGPAALTYPLAGVAGVSVARPTALRGYTETDDDLRRRVKGLITGAGGGTLKAMERAVLATGKARSVLFRDANSEGEPVLLPGELEVVIDADLDSPEAYQAVKEALYESKGPGIVVRLRGITAVPVTFELKLQLAGSSISAERRQTIRQEVETVVLSAVEGLGVGQKLLWNPLQAKILLVDGVLDLDEALVRVGGGAAQAPGRELPATLRQTDRLVLPEEIPGVIVAFGDEARIYLRVTAGVEPPAADRAAIARSLEEFLRQKNLQKEVRTLTYAELADALIKNTSGGVLAGKTLTFTVTQEAGGGQTTLAAPDAKYTVGADERIYPDPAGFEWRNES